MTELFKARDLVNRKKAQLIELLPDTLSVEFEDNVVIETTKKKVIFSRFFWKLHSFYPMTPVLSRHFIDYVLKGKPLNSNTHIDLLTVIHKDVIETYGLHLPEQKEHILSLIYEITNDIYNEGSMYSEDSVMSIDILDFIEIVDHPVIKEATNNLSNSKDIIYNDKAVYDVYQIVNNVLNTDATLKNNSLVKAMKSKMVNSNQVSQCVAVRGFLTEVDGSILPVPILSNFTKGLTKLYDFIAESRSAAKALYFSEAPLQDAEYFARRLQLLTMTIESIHHGDCGSTEYMEWFVGPPTYDDNGKEIYPGDLNYMFGKYYLDESTGNLKEITFNDPALHNKVIKIRSVRHCKLHDPKTICSVCFGGLSRNISRFANLGHLVSATLTQQTSQSVLSTKHLDGSSVITAIHLTEQLGQYFKLNKSKNAYIIKDDYKNKKAKLIISCDEAIGLIDIVNVSDLENISPVRISSISCAEIRYLDKKNNEIAMPLMINQGNRKAIITIEFLKYLKIYRWEIDNKNNFVFDLTNWDFSLPVFKLPETEYSFSDHSKQVASIIESSMENISDRENPHSFVLTLQELFGLVNTKLNVNIAALEVILYANMVKGEGSFALARNQANPVLNVANQVIKNRSLSVAYAYEDVSSSLTNPKNFYQGDRPDSIFDVFFCPNEVTKHYPGK